MSGADRTYEILGIDGHEASDLELGYGLFGVVFRRAHDRALKLPMLFKGDETSQDWSLSFEESANRSNPKVFAHELNVLKSLGNHPSLVKVFSYSVEGGIEMELLSGGSLESFLEVNPAVPLERRIQWCLQIAEGLQYMHSRGVIHTDLALRNILLDDQSNVRIIDFSNCVLESEPDEIDETATVHTDMFDFASAMYSLMTWKIFRLELIDYLIAFCRYGEERGTPRGWPKLADLPNMEGVPHGDFLLDCWLRKYDNMDVVCSKLRKSLQVLQTDKISAPPINPTSKVLAIQRWMFDHCSGLMRFWWHLWARFYS